MKYFGNRCLPSHCMLCFCKQQLVFSLICSIFPLVIDYICFVTIQTAAILDQKIRKYAWICLEAAIHGLEMFQSKYYIIHQRTIFQHRNLGMSFFRSLNWIFSRSPFFFPQENFKTVLLILNMIEIHIKYWKRPSELKMWETSSRFHYCYAMLLRKSWKDTEFPDKWESSRE